MIALYPIGLLFNAVVIVIMVLSHIARDVVKNPETIVLITVTGFASFMFAAAGIRYAITGWDVSWRREAHLNYRDGDLTFFGRERSQERKSIFSTLNNLMTSPKQ